MRLTTQRAIQTLVGLGFGFAALYVTAANRYGIETVNRAIVIGLVSSIVIAGWVWKRRRNATHAANNASRNAQIAFLAETMHNPRVPYVTRVRAQQQLANLQLAPNLDGIN